MHPEETTVRFEVQGFGDTPYREFAAKRAEVINATREFGRVVAAHMTEDCDSLVVVIVIHNNGWDARADASELREELAEIAGGYVAYRRVVD